MKREEEFMFVAPATTTFSVGEVTVQLERGDIVKIDEDGKVIVIRTKKGEIEQ